MKSLAQWFLDVLRRILEAEDLDDPETGTDDWGDSLFGNPAWDKQDRAKHV